LNAFFRTQNLPEIICPSLDDFPGNFTLPNGTDKGMSKQESREIRHSFLEKMFQLGFLSTISLDLVLTQQNKNVYFILFCFTTARFC
jgi:hypothetical protein